MWRAEEAWRAELQATTVADILGELAQKVPSNAAAKAVVWMQEVLS